MVQALNKDKIRREKPEEKLVDLRSAKNFADERMPGSPAAAQALARQPDKIPVSLFLQLLPLLLQIGELKQKVK